MTLVKWIVWALPRGQTDRLHERPLTSFAITSAQADKVEAAASKDGWHSFRRAPDSDEIPDFTKGLI